MFKWHFIPVNSFIDFNVEMKPVNLYSSYQKDIKFIISHILPMVLSLKDELKFHNSTEWHICESKFIVREHCHPIEKYQGPAYFSYNFEFKNLKKISKFRFSFRIDVLLP